MKHIAGLPLFFSFALAAPALGDLRLLAPCSSGMVVQRESRVPVRGRANPGVEVRLSADWLEAPLVTRAAHDGAFEFDVETPAAGGPFELTVAAGEERLELEDVWSGEVWLTSGQSNMEWKVGWALHGIPDVEAARADAERPRLRFFDVQNAIDLAPVAEVQGTWITSSPETWESFGAVAYWFARALVEELDVPVGIVSPEWGGTAIESWIGRATLARLGDFDEALARLDAALASGERPEDALERERAAWFEALDAREADRAIEAGFPRASADDLDDTEWAEVQVPGLWDGELADFDGVVWYRRSVDLPREWQGRGLVLSLGAIDDVDTTWFGAVQVGGLMSASAWNVPRLYTIRGEFVSGGRTHIAVRAVDTGGAGGFSSEASELWIAPRDAMDEALSLAGTWRMRVGPSLAELEPYPRTTWFHPSFPTALSNAMIAPLEGLPVRGVLWYQGEANRSRGAQYRRLMPALIEDWRARWGSELPFYWVQIAPFGYGGDTGQAAELREAQTLALALPHTGMAVTMDVGNPLDIHPADKRTVGERLARIALAQDYGRQELDCRSPLLERSAVEGARMRLFFGEALTAAEGGLEHFTIAGADRVFHPASAEIEGMSVVVSSPDVPDPVAVRYCWGAADAGTLFDGAGLPAPSFRTDDWPRPE